ncbi:hypothetical protein PsYK624_170620 [Phanerochaete sordida]|uniref:Uncharacterized protein n=1 Tax=Phanerochaete sordida TaxID=48140 RepID=A0A9P3GRX9_9APHY|nr:hypothetical protein PsYK624_170620 [Phanerochaete sordida]
MALILHNGRFIRDQWPSLPRVEKDPLTLENADPANIVPDTREELLHWAYVQKAADSVPSFLRFDVLHNAIFDDARLAHRVVVRVQGFVAKAEMSTLGTWNGNHKMLPQASQFLVLNGGEHHALFTAQCKAMTEICGLVYSSLHLGDRPEVGGKSLRLSRRVFTKRTAEDDRPNLLLRSDDPKLIASNLPQGWFVANKVVFAYQDEQGKLRPCTHMVFRRGDFVDVAVGVDVYRTNGQGGRQWHVDFTMERVIKLKSGQEVNLAKGPKPAPKVSSVGSARVVAQQDFELDIDVGTNSAHASQVRNGATVENSAAGEEVVMKER